MLLFLACRQLQMFRHSIADASRLQLADVYFARRRRRCYYFSHIFAAPRLRRFSPLRAPFEASMPPSRRHWPTLIALSICERLFHADISISPQMAAALMRFFHYAAAAEAYRLPPCRQPAEFIFP